MSKFRVIGKDITIIADRVEKIGEEEEIKDGMVIRGDIKPPVYLVQQGKKRWIRTAEVLNKILADLHTEVKFFPQSRVDPIEQGKDITEWPEEPVSPNPYSEVRGLLTLNPRPTKEEALDLGFNLVLPFSDLVEDWTGKIIPCTSEVYEDERILVYSICDEPDCRNWTPQEVLDSYKRMKQNTQKPVGTIICCAFGCRYPVSQEWTDMLNHLDLILPTTYAYRDSKKWPGCDTPVEYMSWFEKYFRENVTIPVLPIIQAHWRTPAGPELFEPNVMEQVKFWVDKGYGYIVYPWKDDGGNGVNMRREQWKEANNYKGR